MGGGNAEQPHTPPGWEWAFSLLRGARAVLCGGGCVPGGPLAGWGDARVERGVELTGCFRGAADCCLTGLSVGRVIISLLVFAGFLLLSIRRLRRMDVP